ncbi:hypothetical protein AIIMSPaA1_043 [Pseudomonas phage AIIMS-Pa-A1]|uniref:Uncharacterized protein n=1 Tax=Pseudomonas phage AIIMS-Pa-A1 TaxID=2794941 RepID=A0A7T1X547_9CAUD|nr:hypothetical protein AIIMSPaA1_043 [Pseudomonas phage AIIMS-Pa-A1]
MQAKNTLMIAIPQDPTMAVNSTHFAMILHGFEEGDLNRAHVLSPGGFVIEGCGVTVNRYDEAYRLSTSLEAAGFDVLLVQGSPLAGHVTCKSFGWFNAEYRKGCANKRPIFDIAGSSYHVLA